MTAPVAAALAALLASAGAYLIATSAIFGGRRSRRRQPQRRLRHWLTQAGLGEVGPKEVVAAIVAVSVAGGLAAFVLFGALLPAAVAGLACAALPVTTLRRRRVDRMTAAAEAWPRLLEELRLLTGSMGRSVPQALFEVGRRAPVDWRPAFAAAEREWLLTTDFPRTASLLKDRLADPTVDVVCETLIVAHDIGGTDLERRLSALIEDRHVDVQERKDAASRQAGVRFARRFVLLVPLGMTLAGLSIGSGRQAYTTPGGQLAVVVGLVAVVACWTWSGRLMRLPAQPRVFR